MCLLSGEGWEVEKQRGVDVSSAYNADIVNNGDLGRKASFLFFFFLTFKRKKSLSIVCEDRLS